MGSVISSHAEDYKISKLIDDKLRKDGLQLRRIIKLLLLGPGDCGKSTVLKQMRILHDSGFSDAEVIVQRAVIRGNLLQAITSILHGMKKIGVALTNSDREDDARLVLEEQIKEDYLVDFIRPELCAAISRLWLDWNLRNTLCLSHKFQLIDSAAFLLENINRICAKDYIPNQRDILMARRKTTGIVEFNFELGGRPFLIVDVGGQRNQRRKWIHCFENVNSILYIAAVSEFNQLMRVSPSSMNRMIDAIRLFGSVANSKWFKNTHMLLFLNKIDLFAKKITKASITDAFPEYSGPQDYENCLKYIEERFLHKNRNSRNIYCHKTCATDTQQMDSVLSFTLDAIKVNAMKTANMY